MVHFPVEQMICTCNHKHLRCPEIGKRRGDRGIALLPLLYLTKPWTDVIEDTLVPSYRSQWPSNVTL